MPHNVAETCLFYVIFFLFFSCSASATVLAWTLVQFQHMMWNKHYYGLKVKKFAATSSFCLFHQTVIPHLCFSKEMVVNCS